MKFGKNPELRACRIVDPMPEIKPEILEVKLVLGVSSWQLPKPKPYMSPVRICKGWVEEGGGTLVTRISSMNV